MLLHVGITIFFFCFSFLYVAVVLNCPPHAAQRHLNMEEWQNKKIEQIRSVTNENNKQFSLPSDRGRKKTNNKRTLFISFFLCLCVFDIPVFFSHFSQCFFSAVHRWSALVGVCRWRLTHGSTPEQHILSSSLHYSPGWDMAYPLI